MTRASALLTRLDEATTPKIPREARRIIRKEMHAYNARLKVAGRKHESTGDLQPLRSRAGYLVEQALDIKRSAYQIFITPRQDGSARVRLVDELLGHDHLQFAPLQLTQEALFRLIPHTNLTRATYEHACERGDTYGIFISPTVLQTLTRTTETDQPRTTPTLIP